MLDSVEKELSKHDYRALFSSAEELLAEKARLPGILRDRVLDGVLLIGKIDPQFLSILKSRGLPVVVIGLHDLGSDVSSAGTNNLQGGYRATEYLLGLGHRRIGFLGGPSEYPADKKLLEGYRSALEEFAVDYEESLVK